MNRSKIGDRLRSVIKEKGLTRKDLYDLCKDLFTENDSFSFATLNCYIRGETIPRLQRVKLIAQALGVDYDWLLNGEREQLAVRIGDWDSLTLEDEPVMSLADENFSTRITIQRNGEDISITNIREKCLCEWIDQYGDGTIRSLDVYIKPEEHKAYWVVNKTDTGSVEI